MNTQATNNLDKFRREEIARMESSLRQHKDRLSDELISFIKDPYYSKEWDFLESDGCSGWKISEFGWVTRFFPPCVSHDFYCRQALKAPSRKAADSLRRWADWNFFRANLAYGMPLWKGKNPDGTKIKLKDTAIGRLVGVRVWWSLVTRWRV